MAEMSPGKMAAPISRRRTSCSRRHNRADGRVDGGLGDGLPREMGSAAPGNSPRWLVLRIRPSGQGRRSSRLGLVDVHAADEPEHDKNDQYQAESAADSRCTIPVVPVVSTSPTEQQDQQDNDQDCTHFPLSLLTPDIALAAPSHETMTTAHDLNSMITENSNRGNALSRRQAGSRERPTDSKRRPKNDRSLDLVAPVHRRWAN